ncbi:LPXTG cell wall anchor domain-containing protein, partial [Nocardia zapadnayensis]
PSVSPSPDAQPTHTDSPTAPGGRDDDSTDDSASGSGRGDSPGSLPRTGTQVLGLLGIGAVLVAVGAVAVLRVRRRG